MVDENQGSNETDGQNQENPSTGETQTENESQQSGTSNKAEGGKEEQTQDEILDALLTESAKQEKPTQSGHNFDKGLSKMQERMSVLSKQIENLTNASLNANKPVDADPLSGLNDDDVMDVGASRRMMNAIQKSQEKQAEAFMARMEKMQQDTTERFRSSVPKHQMSDKEILSNIEKAYDISPKAAELIATRAIKNLNKFKSNNPDLNETAAANLGRELIDLEAQKLKLELKQSVKDDSESESEGSGNAESTTVTKKGAKSITKTKPTVHKTATSLKQAKQWQYERLSG